MTSAHDETTAPSGRTADTTRAEANSLLTGEVDIA
jgi:hypothetical protein